MLLKKLYSKFVIEPSPHLRLSFSCCFVFVTAFFILLYICMYSTHMHTHSHLYVRIYVLYVIIFSSVFIANHVKRKNVNVNTTRQTTKLTQLSQKNNNNKSTLHFHFPRGSECVKSLQRRIESHSPVYVYFPNLHKGP